MSKQNEREATLTEISNWYGTALQQHNIDSKSVGWKDRDSQYLRFQKLFSVVDENDWKEPLIFSDYGAGYGEMFKFLDERCCVARYDAYEINPFMRDAGAGYLKDERAVFINSSKMEHKADYTFVSGTFNLRMENEDDSWESFVKKTIVHLFEKSQRGVAFNCLSSYVDWKQDNLFYADPKDFFHFCKTHLSKYVTLLHDYPLYEWTLCIKKEGVA